MDKIDKYIEKIFCNFDERDEETKIIKEETKVHLLDEIEELKKQGYTEEKCIDIAISSFGNEKNVIREMSEILKKQNKLLDLFKKLSIIIFIIATLLKLINIGDKFLFNSENLYETNLETSMYVINDITTIIKKEELISESLGKKITQILDEYNMKTNNGLFYIKIYDRKNPSIYFEYSKSIPDDLKEDRERAGIVIGKWIMYYGTSETQSNIDYNISKQIFIKTQDSWPAVLASISIYLYIVSIIFLLLFIVCKIYLRADMKSQL